MAKKKATMTLKDFHGGSIPSDLPLPSAPGVSARPLDRQMYWGINTGRSDHRLRPGSAGAARNFDEKALFLSNSAPIGRNFDEDERKPLDGIPGGPRRMVSDESIYSQPNRVEPKSNPVSAPVPHIQSSTSGSSYASRFSEVNNVRNPQTSIGNNHIHTSSTNAWGLRKEAMGIKEPSASTGLSTLDTASKLLHASAIDKISSGRWSLKQQMSFPTETKKESHYSSNEMNDQNSYSATHHRNNNLVIHAEQNLALRNGIHSNMELASQERVHSSRSYESLENRQSINAQGLHQSQGADKHNESELRSSVAPESSERPKLKLLPRSKPVENYPPHVLGHHQHSDPSHLEYGGDMNGSNNLPKNDLERPKLNLKPRSQPPEQSNKNEGKRSTVFGGARPREVVLKERGFDPCIDHDHQPQSKNKQDVSRRNRQSETLRNNSKNHESEERPPSPETWRRKPVEEPPEKSGGGAPPPTPPGGARFGKVASAVELASAFSRPASARPFSRLMGSSARPQPQINSY